MDPFSELVFAPRVSADEERFSECCRDKSTVSLVEVVGGAYSERDLAIEDLDTLYPRDHSGKPSLRIFFVAGELAEVGYHVHVDPVILKGLVKAANLPGKFISDVYATEEWSRLPFSSVARRSPDDKIEEIALQYGFWAWDQKERPEAGDLSHRDGPNSSFSGNEKSIAAVACKKTTASNHAMGEDEKQPAKSSHSFIYSTTNFQQATYVCINFPYSFETRIRHSLMNAGKLAHKSFLLEVLIMDELLLSYREAISNRNVTLIKIEKEDVDETIREQTMKLHKLSVNWHSIYKDLGDLGDQLSTLRELYNECARGQDQSQDPHLWEGCDHCLSKLYSECGFYSRWGMTYRDRTTSRINLLHHLAAQSDNELMRGVSMNMQRDSASMFTLAVITVIFLPGAFINSIFGTNLFAWDSESVLISRNWWLLLAVEVPLTAVVFACWLLWFRTRYRQDTLKVLVPAERGGWANGTLRRLQGRRGNGDDLEAQRTRSLGEGMRGSEYVDTKGG